MLDTLSSELNAVNRHPVDPYSKFLYDRLREFYWTCSRILRHAGQLIAARRSLTSSTASVSSANPPHVGAARLLIDMTNTIESGAKTGIQRVVREIARECAELGVGVPVTIQDGRLVPYYRQEGAPDHIDPAAGDIFLILDAAWNNVGDYPPLIAAVRSAGGTIVACVYDILPLLYPPLFNLDAAQNFDIWRREIVLKSDGVVAISRATAESVAAFEQEKGESAVPPIGWWPLGADFAQASGEPGARATTVAGGPPYMLGVGTLEPRKAYPVALAAFERLWAAGNEIRYVIVGRAGWNTQGLQQRLRSHPEAGRRLHWFENASDADLHLLYAKARAVVNCSPAEGFGLPLVEAAFHGVPVIVSDIPVFREVAGDGARYFDLLDSNSLARAIEAELAAPRAAPKISTISWRQSAEALVKLIRERAYQLPAKPAPR